MSAELNERRFFLKDVAHEVNRRPSTVRGWTHTQILPSPLMPQRNDRGWRYWTPEQVEGIKTWIRETNRKPGKGLPNYNPTEAEVDRAIELMRKPRKTWMNRPDK